VIDSGKIFTGEEIWWNDYV